MVLTEKLMSLPSDEHPMEIVEGIDGNVYFRLNEDFYQALWWLDYSFIQESGLQFISNNTDKSIIHLNPVSLPGKEGQFVHFNVNKK